MATQRLTAKDIARVVAYNLLSVHKDEDAQKRVRTDTTQSGASGFTDFKRAMWRGYIHAPHLQMVDEALSNALRYLETDGRDGWGKVIISVPPRHGKTMTVSKLFPAYALGRNPSWRVMLVSYAANLARKNSRYARNLMRTDAYKALYPSVQIAGDSRAVDAWDTSMGGGMDALGVGGSATGKGANLLIIDDPIKNRSQAESATYRDKVWDGYTDDLYTRLEPNGVQIVMMTRWHLDDLVGRLLKYHLEGWHVVTLPAIAEDGDLLGRVPGEALWGERYPVDKLEDIHKTLGDYSWSALYQQKPTPSEGGIFKRAWFYPSPTEPPVIKRVVRYWDMAMSSNNSADYTVGVKLGEGIDGLYYVLDVARIQRDWSDVVPFIKRVILGDGKGVRQGLEKKGYMSRAVGDLNKDRDLHGYVIGGYDVDTDKLTRALPVAAKLGAGVIKVLDGVWTDVFIDEMCMFPNGVHDDQVDALAGAWSMMDSTERRPISVEMNKYV
jgi:predicted phage terminase large subunit-like protein